MRQIIFRGRRTSNGEWVYGDLYHHADGNVFIVFRGSNRWGNYQVDPSTVGQFTGLKDCEGKDIYEGDIVEAVYKYEGLGGNGGVIPDCDCICKGVIWWNGNVSGWVLKILSAEYPIRQMMEGGEIDCVPLNIFYEEYMGSDYMNEWMEVIGTIHEGKEE